MMGSSYSLMTVPDHVIEKAASKTFNQLSRNDHHNTYVIEMGHELENL